jgi:hypothetical protein
MRTFKIVALAGAMLSLGIVNAGVSSAAPNCVNTTLTGVIAGSVTVPSGAWCEIGDGVVATTVTGSVIVKPGAEVVINTATINGSLTVDGTSGAHVGYIGNNVVNSVIKGSVTVQNTPLNESFVFFATSASGVVPDAAGTTGGNRVGGSVTFKNNLDFVALDYTKVAGAVTATGNKDVEIAANVIAGSLTCKTNVPVNVPSTPYTSGYNNLVTGAMTGQCQMFVEGPVNVVFP